jgi:hypothetical protein
VHYVMLGEHYAISAATFDVKSSAPFRLGADR